MHHLRNTSFCQGHQHFPVAYNTVFVKVSCVLKNTHCITEYSGLFVFIKSNFCVWLNMCYWNTLWIDLKKLISYCVGRFVDFTGNFYSLHFGGCFITNRHIYCCWIKCFFCYAVLFPSFTSWFYFFQLIFSYYLSYCLQNLCLFMF